MSDEFGFPRTMDSIQRFPAGSEVPGSTQPDGSRQSQENHYLKNMGTIGDVGSTAVGSVTHSSGEARPTTVENPAQSPQSEPSKQRRNPYMDILNPRDN